MTAAISPTCPGLAFLARYLRFCAYCHRRAWLRFSSRAFHAAAIY